MSGAYFHHKLKLHASVWVHHGTLCPAAVSSLHHMMGHCVLLLFLCSTTGPPPEPYCQCSALPQDQVAGCGRGCTAAAIQQWGPLCHLPVSDYAWWPAHHAHLPGRLTGAQVCRASAFQVCTSLELKSAEQAPSRCA